MVVEGFAVPVGSCTKSGQLKNVNVFTGWYIPIAFHKLDIGLLSLIWLKVHTGLEPIHFKCLVDTAFSIQICRADETIVLKSGGHSRMSSLFKYAYR